MTDPADDGDAPRSADGTESSADSYTGSDPDLELMVQVPFDGDERHDLTVAIIAAVAEAEGVKPTVIKDPPLDEVVDTVALETVFDGDSTDVPPDGSYLSVAFRYRDHRIAIRNDGWVQVFDTVSGR